MSTLRFPPAQLLKRFFLDRGVFFSVFAVFLLSPVASVAQTCGAPVAQCTLTFSDCAIPEDVQLRIPFLVISGDTVLAPTLNSNLHGVSDVFHIDNNSPSRGGSGGVCPRLGVLHYRYTGAA